MKVKITHFKITCVSKVSSNLLNYWVFTVRGDYCLARKEMIILVWVI